ncbi:LacI family transcriptional regulator [Brevibacterium casei]|uniref:LacI family DNA-binding transcriptional regulator n=1 Tax=Brevibacterium casei TaxID=33889 RepID=UPI0021A8A39C|nr:LacI family DNA-binding transcriptional regulator [Brevibacterium casei]MCT2360059.1 LacI family transcriptional regulator [Brevibacterium casei]
MVKQHDRPTLATVAERAGVSIKTASRVLNGEKHVASTTAAKVESAAEELGFRLNSAARRLREGSRSPYIGVVLSDMGDPLQVRILARLEHDLADLGLRPVVTVTGGDPDIERSFVDDCLGGDMSGICVVCSQPESADLYARVAGQAASAKPGEVGVVSLDPAVAGPGITTIGADDVAAGRRAAEQLVRHGHISIGVIGDRSLIESQARRFAGIREVLAGRGDIGWRAYLETGAHDQSSAKNVVAALLGSRAAPTALITLSATVTMGAIDASRRLDQWPAVVGIDDFPGADLLDVTVVDPDVDAMSAEAVRIITGDHRRSSGTGSIPLLTSANGLTPVRLIRRGSGEESPRQVAAR